MRAMTSSTLSASTWAVVILVAVLPSNSAARASHLDLVRLAMHSSVNTSLTLQHLRMATEATPPQPMTNTRLMFHLPFYVPKFQQSMGILWKTFLGASEN